MNKEQKRTMYWILTETHGKLTSSCNACDDMDCKKSAIYPFLAKKHQVSVINITACKKQQKKEAKRTKKKQSDSEILTSMFMGNQIGEA